MTGGRPAANRRPARAGRPGACVGPSTVGAAWWRAGFRRTRSSSTCSCTCRSLSSSIFAFNDTDRRSPTGTAFSSLRWFGVALNDPGRSTAPLLNSFLVAVPTAILATVFGTMAALGLQRGRARWLRLFFDALTYMSIIVPEIVIALATLVFFATRLRRVHRVGPRASRSISATRRSSPAMSLFNISLVLLLVRARLSGMDRTSRRGELRPVRDAVADVLADHVPAAPAGHRRRLPAGVHVQLRRLRHHDVRVRTGIVDAAAVHLRPGQARVTPETNAVATLIIALPWDAHHARQLVLLVGQQPQGRRRMASMVAASGKVGAGRRLTWRAGIGAPVASTLSEPAARPGSVGRGGGLPADRAGPAVAMRWRAGPR